VRITDFSIIEEASTNLNRSAKVSLGFRVLSVNDLAYIWRQLVHELSQNKEQLARRCRVAHWGRSVSASDKGGRDIDPIWYVQILQPGGLKTTRLTYERYTHRTATIETADGRTIIYVRDGPPPTVTFRNMGRKANG
jgi:hypothetical protein